MASNRGIAYVGPGRVEVQSIDFPKLVGPGGRRCEHGVILKVVTTNICGSDQHMVRGRTTAPAGLILGHEITGEVIEAGTRCGVHQGRRPCFRAVQRGLRSLSKLQGTGDGGLSERECRRGRVAPMAMWTWADGSAVRPSTS